MGVFKIGHRGAKGHIAENTLPSFEKAIALGAEAIEFDVHVCATGELVVIHDFTVDRTTNGTGEVHTMSLDELKSLTVEGEYTIPTLEEVMELMGPNFIMNIEMKGRHTAQPLATLVQQYVAEKGYRYKNIIVSSFQYEELKMMSALNPEVHLGVLTQASVAQAWDWATEFNAKALHPHFSLLTETNVERAREAGFKINTWTVNEPDDIARMKMYGVDGIISDYPERL
ncbi:glycerophosphodiester phosphodiesterase [Flavobacterium sp. D11R37]|uniref:glycerophosphodiester phosphodiesterase n=1 Tax=Flavobacterium coralii TaxID=2838017 RepID=UPI001CA7A213|nr:glycerophosphodiester phosphodiesterase family protein [Flavobacterium coralii]MBY8963417.1 glycerophosphodiester phosphodiesterase [Flavobacterium coralii]